MTNASTTLPNSRAVFITLAAVMLLALVARALPGARTIDDAFITFRYSRNIVEGAGFVYNPAVHTLGTTTPLFTLVMAGMSAITGGQDFQYYAIAVSALADAGTAALLVLLLRRATGSLLAGGLLGALWAVSPMSVTFAVGGMETSVNIFWMVAAVWLFGLTPVSHSSTPRLHRMERGLGGEVPAAWRGSRRVRLGDARVWMGVCAGFGILTRIDAVLWVAPLFAWQLAETWWRGRGQPLPTRIPWRTWAACALVLAPWLLFSWVYFGSPLPNSVNAKTVAYIMPPGTALVRLIQTYSTPFFEFDTFGATGAMIGAAAYLALNAVALLTAARRIPRLVPFLVYPWVYLLAFSIANPLIFRWYNAPPLPALMFGIVAGAWWLVSGIVKPHPPIPSPSYGEGSKNAHLAPASHRPLASRLAPLIVGALGVVWLGTSLNGWTLQPDHGPNRPAPRMAWHQIELLYEQVGTALREAHGVTPQTRVGSADIGAVGYFSRATIIDTVGLVTPELRRYYPVDPALIPAGQNYAIPPALILDTQPEYLVTMEAFVRLGLAQDAAFTGDYTLLDEIPTGFYGTGMQLWGRNRNQLAVSD